MLVELSGDKFGDAALGAFGRLLHAVQDLYSHSNWIELHQDFKPIPAWDLRLDDLPSDIVSGTWMLGKPKKCGPGAPTHEELNKDKPTSKEGSKAVDFGPNKGETLYELAFATAIMATRAQFERFKATKVIRKPDPSGEKVTITQRLELDLCTLLKIAQETHQLRHQL